MPDVLGSVLGFMGTEDQISAQQQAAQTTADANRAAANQQYQMFEEQQANMKPWVTAGTSAINALSALTSPGYQSAPGQAYFPSQDAGALYNTKYPGGDFSFTPSDLTTDPSYKFDVQAGTNALAAKSAAAGNYGSGNMGTALVDYGQGMASNEFQNAWTRAYNQYNANYNNWNNSQNTLYNRLAGIAGTGQNATQNMANLGMNTASNIGQSNVNAANAQAAGQVGAANSWSGYLNNMGNNMNSAAGNVGNYFQNQSMMNNYMNNLSNMNNAYGSWNNPGYSNQYDYGNQAAYGNTGTDWE